MLVRNDEEYIIKNDSVVTLQGKRNKKLKANNLYLIGNGADGPYIKSIKYITCIYLNVTTTVTCKSVKVKAFILNDIFYSSQSILSLIVIINKLQSKEKKNFLYLFACFLSFILYKKSICIYAMNLFKGHCIICYTRIFCIHVSTVSIILNLIKAS